MWLTNNWRSNQGLARKSHSRIIRDVEVIWHMDSKRVLHEVATILKVDTVTTSTPGWFGYRTQATRQILEKMSKEELEEVEIVRKRMASEGNSKVHQRK
jgi:predicted DNA-binding transcriptional regulator